MVIYEVRDTEASDRRWLVTSVDVAAACLRLSWSAFDDVKIERRVGGGTVTLDVRVEGLPTRSYEVRSVNVIDAPEHL